MVPVWDELLARQHGVVTRQQALACGITDKMIASRMCSGRWQRVHTGVFATFSGVLPRPSELWAAVLRSGPAAMLSHQSAAELAGLVDKPVDSIHVTVPPGRRPRHPPGIVIHISRHAADARHPSRLPPQTRVEETVVDLTQAARRLDEALGWIIRACARRVTTVERLRPVFAARRKLRWRSAINGTLDDVSLGAHSTLEQRYLHDVERRHGLPQACRQTIRSRRGGRWYNDVEYVDYATLVEVDGPAAHPDEARGRDNDRDNAATEADKRVLRYGPIDIRGRPCVTARQVAAVLRRNGWPGWPRPCGPSCVIAKVLTPDSAQNRPRSRSG